MYPSIGLGESMVWSTQIVNNRTRSNSPNGIVSVGPILNIPLFDWGMRLAAEHAKGYELQASVLAYRHAVLQAVAEVETALGNLQQQRQREQHDLIAWQALRRASQATQTRVGLQLSSAAEHAETQIAADQAAIELADARAQHSLAYVALFKALGGAPLPAAEVPPAAGASDAAPAGTATVGGEVKP
jgi:outer membrane protein TolC